MISLCSGGPGGIHYQMIVGPALKASCAQSDTREVVPLRWWGGSKPKYKHLLADQDVRRWYENLEGKSVIMATVYLRTLGLYCDLLKTTPKKILTQAPSKKFRDYFTDFTRRMEKDGKAGSYIERFKKVVISCTSYKNLDVNLKVNTKGSSDTPTIANERVPSKDELSRILRMASPRRRVSIAMIVFSCLRPESLGGYLGTDGIRLGDFTEAKISSGGIEFEKVPIFCL